MKNKQKVLRFEKASGKISVSVYLPEDVIQAVDHVAERERRSRSQVIVMYLEEELKADRLSGEK